MKRGEYVLIDRFHRYGADVLVAAGLEDALGIGAVGLVATDVRADVVRRKEYHPVAEGLQFPSPMLGRAARLHYHGGLRLLSHEGKELRSLRPLPPYDVARPVGDRDLED